MKLYKGILSRGSKVLIAAGIGTWLLTSCNPAGESKTLSNRPEPQKVESPNGATQTVKHADEMVSFKGIEFQYDSNVIDSVEVQDVPEYIPKDPTFLPNTFEPRHLNFKFKGATLRSVRQGDYPAEINIYSVEQYKRSAKRTGEYFKLLLEKFQNLQNILAGNQTDVSGSYPFIPWIGATQAVRARRAFISFKNGNGIGYLTQFNMDVDLVNNSKLLYVFQGLTTDSKYFISATFPVRTSYLPDDRDADTYRNYERPDDFYAAEHREKNLQEYKLYLLNVQTELENTNDEDFKPRLSHLNQLLSSMLVQPTISSPK